MYKLSLHLDTDGDFGHNCSTINDDNPIVDIYYTNRTMAIIKLRIFYSTLVGSICTSKEHLFDVLDTIKDFKEYLELMIEKFDTFSVKFQIGNPEFEIKLLEVNPEPQTCGGTILKEHTPNIHLYINTTFKEDINWESLNSISSNVKGSELNETV